MKGRKSKKGAAEKKRPAKKLGLAKYSSSSKPSKTKARVRSDDSDIKDVSTKNLPNKKNKQKDICLLDRCKNQMSSSLLRLMNEALYTSDTKDVSLDKDKFEAYHKAYALACESWPTKPIDYIIKFIKKRLLSKKSIKKMKFADIGCGREPLLKRKLPSKAKVLSFDLVSMDKDVVEANMERLPVEDNSINCIVYSLSLMAKNLGQVLLEGKRILKVGGSMLIVEITSRFEGREKKFIADNQSDHSNSCLNIQLKPCTYKTR